MSRTLLCVALVVALFACAQAQTNQIQTSVWVGSDAATCSGPAAFNSTTDAGVCKAAGSAYTADFCSDDGAYIYTITFDDMNCTAARAYTMVQLPTTCGWSSNGVRRFCTNPSAGPKVPSSLSFPPSGWATFSSCANITSGHAATTCTDGGNANIHCTKAAAQTGFCYKAGEGVWEANYCTADGSKSGSALFSDNGCTQLLRAELTATGCNSGSQVTCGSGNAVFPALPNIGYTEFDSKDCVVNPNNAPTVYLFNSGCVDSQKFACGAMINGTQSATLTTFTDPAGKGACPGTGKDDTQLVGVCNKAKVFTCQYVPPSNDNSAAAASTSFVTLAVAALLALVAKQL
jgi:hypothetical protein